MTGEGVLRGSQGLLERDRELAEIDAHIGRATAEQGSFLVLEGRSGMGKSALLDEVRRRAAAAGLAVCSAQGSELEEEFAFGIVRQLFEPAVSDLSEQERAAVFQGAAALAEPVLDINREQVAGDQFATLHGLYWLAANLAGRTPLLMAVDDAHWADVASLRWLAYLLNRLEGLPILVAIAARPLRSGRQGDLLTAILANAHVRVLTVLPLGDRSVAPLVRTTLGADPDPLFAAACLQATAGNPLGLKELLRELWSRGIAPTGSAAANLEQRAPDPLTRRVLRDLNLLGREAERLAEALAVIGDGTELRLVARLAGLAMDRAVEAADDLLAADLLAPDRPPRFFHPLLRTAVYDRLPAASRQKLHRRAAQILACEGGEPEAIAAHLLRCEADGGSDTIRWLRTAAPLATRRGAPEAAVSYLRRALAEEADAATRATLLAELGRAEVAAGDASAIDHLREALTGTTDQRSRAATLGDLALAVLVQKGGRACRDLLEEAVEELRGCDPDASARAECFVAGMSNGDLRFASTVDRHYPRLWELAGSNTPNAELARVTLSFLLSVRDGNREEVLSLVRSGFHWETLFDGRYSHVLVILWSIFALLGIDDLQGTAGWCGSVIREASAEGYPVTVVIATIHKAQAEARMGLLAEAEADATAALEMSQQFVPLSISLIGARLAEIYFERGRQAAAYEAIERVSIPVGGADGTLETTIREVRGRLRCARGWRDGGVDDLRASGRLCGLLHLRNPILYPWRSFLATALAQEAVDEARELAREYVETARRCGIRRAEGIALRTLARVDDHDSVDLLRAAVATLEGSQAPLDLARALADLGAALRRQGHRVEARKPLREALEIAARCGAVPLIERAQVEVLATGARPRRPRLRGVDSLTPSETRVARLAAQGHSNREIAQALFITANTVADHLGRAYSKLDIRSRDQLAAALGSSNPHT